jgi:photosystem II stability/assembly factor-like uncharacterized protein
MLLGEPLARDMTHQKPTCQSWAAGLLVLLAGGMGAAARPAAGAAARWTPYGPPAGLVLDLVVGSAGQLFLAAEQSGVYRSRDGGRTWSWSGTGMGGQRARALAADAASGALYAVGDARLFRSMDSGASWQSLSPNLPLDPPPEGGDVVALAPGERTTFYLARGARLFRGSEGGASWREVLDTPTPISALLVDPRNPLSVFAGPAQPPGGYPLAVPWHSADGGSSWSPLSASFDPLPCDQCIEPDPPYFYGTKELAASPGARGALFAVFQYAGSFIYRSVDGGANWHLVSVPPESDGFVASVAVAPSAPGTVYALEGVASQSGGLGLFASQDLGDTWERVDRDGLPPADRLRFDPVTGDLYALTDYGVARGENGGVHWRDFLVDKVNCGGELMPDYGAKLRFPKRSASRVYAVSSLNLYVSDDGGASWSGHDESLPDALDCAQIGDLALDPRRDDTLYAVSDRGVFRSADAGATWQALSADQGGSLGELHTAAVLQDGTILVGGCGVWRSTDAGTSWRQPLPCAVPRPGSDDGGRLVARLIVDPARPRVVYAEVIEAGDDPVQWDPRVYRSADGGRNWSLLPVAANVIAIDPRAPRTLYVLGQTGLTRTDDDGATWRKISEFNLSVSLFESPTGDLLVDPSDSRILWAARPDGVWQSIDGGATWRQRSVGLRGSAALTFFADPHRPGQIEVASSEGLFQTSLP